MLLRLTIAILLFGCAVPAAGQPRTVTQLSYAVYAAGLNVIQVDAKVALARDDYRVDAKFRTAGLFGRFFPVEIDSVAEGGWAGLRPLPRRYASGGLSRGDVRRLAIDFQDGQPILRELIPPDDGEHMPVPPGQERDAIDTLSAMVYLVRNVTGTGTCDGRARLFDGRRVIDIAGRTVGRETLPHEDRAMFHGPAIRCDFEGRQRAGYVKSEPDAERLRVHVSQAWLAEVIPGQPALPVRVVFETRFFGFATAHLTAATPVR